MKVIDTAIAGVKIIEPDYHRDGRRYFVETYNAQRYKAAGIAADFVQDNESFSSKGVVRGLHWQAAPHAQAKLVRVIKGAVWDVAVDIRKGSPTYGQHVACYLYDADSDFARSNQDQRLTTTPANVQFYIPRGFAHGFIVLENNTLFSYKCDNLYCPAADRGLRFDDPALNISWPGYRDCTDAFRKGSEASVPRGHRALDEFCGLNDRKSSYLTE